MLAGNHSSEWVMYWGFGAVVWAVGKPARANSLLDRKKYKKVIASITYSS